MIAAAGAARKATRRVTSTCPPLSSSLPPKKKRENCAIWAMIEMPSAMVAAVDAVRMSRLRTWLSSWDSTPRISRALHRLRIPVVQHTAAWAGFLPVAKAFGEGSSLM